MPGFRGGLGAQIDIVFHFTLNYHVVTTIPGVGADRWQTRPYVAEN